ncbi:DUF4476 domain-containing protein [Leptospira sp. WS92.C1]
MNFLYRMVVMAVLVVACFSVDALGQDGFDNLKERIEREGFMDQRLSVLRSQASRSTFTAEQVAELMDLFNFSPDKIKALGILRNRIEDPENAYVIVERFSFDSDKKIAARQLDGIESALPKPPRMTKRTVCWGSGPGRYCYTEYIQQ